MKPYQNDLTSAMLLTLTLKTKIQQLGKIEKEMLPSANIHPNLKRSDWIQQSKNVLNAGIQALDHKITEKELSDIIKKNPDHKIADLAIHTPDPTRLRRYESQYGEEIQYLLSNVRETIADYQINQKEEMKHASEATVSSNEGLTDTDSEKESDRSPSPKGL